MYLSAAAELSKPANLLNPCLDIMGNMSRYINDILKKLKRWESVPNRREPVTKEMIEYIISKGKSLSKENPNNLYSAMADCLVLGEQTGFRRNEWAQDRTYLKKPKTYIMKDFEFRGKNNNILDNNSTKEVNKASINNIMWRFQRNLDNGQVLSYIEDPQNKLYCAVSASIRIYKRAKNLKIEVHRPIAVFTEYKGSKKICFIDDIHISKFLKEAASKVHGITYKKELAKFTSHSIRFGAYVTLHTQNKNSEDIKFRSIPLPSGSKSPLKQNLIFNFLGQICNFRPLIVLDFDFKEF